MKPRERERVDKGRRGFFRLCAAYVGINAFKTKKAEGHERDFGYAPASGQQGASEAWSRARTTCATYGNHAPGSLNSRP